MLIAAAAALLIGGRSSLTDELSHKTSETEEKSRDLLPLAVVQCYGEWK